MADTKQTPRDEPEPAAGDAPSDDTTAGDAPSDDTTADDTTADDTTADETTADESTADDVQGDAERPTLIGDADDIPAGPYPTRVGWVVAAFLLFWPLAIPALIQSIRTAEANGTGHARRAKKASVRTLDFALGAVSLGVLGIVGLVIGVAAAPTYASSLPSGFVSAARSFVPPALAGPLGITLPDAGDPVAAPTDSLTPAVEPYPTTTADNPPGTYPGPLESSAPDPMPEAGGPEATDEPTTTSSGTGSGTGTTGATAGAEIPELRVGDCIDTSATSGQTTLYRVPVVSCSAAHGGEIYAETTAPDGLAEDGETPTQQALWDAADAYCYPEFTEFVGLRWAESELLYWPIAPSEESWAEGDRRILCVVESEQPVRGSLDGAER